MSKPAHRTPAAETRERILAATEALLRRNGVERTNVVDVAAEAGMSHANVYKHFRSKSELLEAVGTRWLTSILGRLAAIAAGDGPAPARLEAWALALSEEKRRKFVEDPELFETYRVVVEANPPVIGGYLEGLRSQAEGIVRDGVEAGDFEVADLKEVAGAILAALTRFRHPLFIAAMQGRSMEGEIRPLVALLNRGLARGRRS